MLSVRRTCAALALGVGAALLQGCVDATPVDTPPPAADARQGSADLLARGLARALARPELRRQVLEDFRDSPFPQHKIHLTAYLRGERGAALARAAAEGAGLPEARFAELLGSLPALELYVPRITDRLGWTGHAHLVVAASLAEPAGFAAARSRTGYAPDGRAVSYDPRRLQEFVVILVRPAGAWFGGGDPEVLRKRAGRRAGGTITTPTGPAPMVESECGAYSRDCPTSGGGGGTTASGILLPSNVTYSACRTAAADDYDLDITSDGCEYQLAYAFRPQMVMDWEDDAPEREPYWTVRNAGRDSLLVAYLLSYYHDPGEPVTGWTDHNGDSEFIILTIRNVAGTSRWVLEHAVYSAHWGADTDATFDGSAGELEYPFSSRGRPRVWVAENKHANYVHQSSCEWGAYGADECDDPTPGIDLQVLASRNIGNYTGVQGQKLIDCVGSASGGSLRTGIECYFSGEYFAGWAPSPYRESSHAGPYRQVLQSWYFMPRPAGVPIDEGPCDPYAKYCG